MPARLIIEMVSASVFWLNTFPPDDGVSDTLSPRSIVIGLHIDYAKHVQLEFGIYAQVHESHDNTMIPRTTGALALRPTGNIQGGHFFYSLTTGRRISRNHWTILPMPAEVINRVHTLARRDKATTGVSFADRAGNAFAADDESDASDDDDSTYDPDDDSDATGSSDGDSFHDNHHIDIAGVNHPAINIAVDHEDDDDVNAQDDDIETTVGEVQTEEVENKEAEDYEVGDDEVTEATNDDEANGDKAEVVEDNANNNDVIEHEMETKYGQRTDQYALRPRRPRDYNHLHATLASTMMTQHSMKKGIKKFR